MPSTTLWTIFAINFSLFLTCCFSNETHGRIIFPSSDETPRNIDVVSCKQVMTCVRLSSCSQVALSSLPSLSQNGQQRMIPQTCGWEVDEPRVCCFAQSDPVIVDKTAPAIANEKNKLKNEDAFPRTDCAVVSSGSNPEEVLTREFKTTVVGGEDVSTPSKWPFVVAIFIQLGDDKLFLCGGSLISKTTVLCAAHCFENKLDTDTYVVQMGAIELNPTTPSQRFNVTNVIVHEKFRPPSLENDVALVKFTGLKSYSDTVKPICLPDVKSLTSKNRLPTIVGWGSKEFGGGFSQILQEVALPLVSNKVCNSTYASIATAKRVLPNGITRSFMCAGDVNGTRDACQGDSGGPLTISDEASRWTQIGIVSAGIGCGTPGIPGIYTNVSKYIEWIKSKA